MKKKSISKKSIILDLILVLLTGGLWNIWMQYRQIRDFNKVSTHKYSFFKWAFFSLITFFLYHIYHEYKLTRDMVKEVDPTADAEILGLIAGVISATGLWVFVDLYQQELLNRKAS